jgi:hypothetical protein
MDLSVSVVGGWEYSACEKHAAGKALHIRQARPNGPVQLIKAHVRGDEAVADVKADGGAHKGTVNVDHVGLQHGKSFQVSGARRSAGIGPRIDSASTGRRDTGALSPDLERSLGGSETARVGTSGNSCDRRVGTGEADKRIFFCESAICPEKKDYLSFQRRRSTIPF